MALTTEEHLSWQLAVVNLCCLVLASTLSTALLRALTSQQQAPLTPNQEFFSITGLFCVSCAWFGELMAWGYYMEAASSSARNMAMLYGTVAANAGVGYLLTRRTGAGVRDYVAAIVWPMNAGLMVGTLMAAV